MAGRYLPIYLNDHLAGATAGVEIAKRASSENADRPIGETLTRLAREIEEDRDALRSIMEALGVRADPVKTAVAWAGEKAGRLKLNGQLRGYSPLSPLVEVEALLLGVNGKLSLWRTLRELAPHEPRLDAAQLAELEARAERQRGDLDRLRSEAGARALIAS
jgi:hypothetical protein